MSHTPGPWSKDCLAIGAKRDRISIKDANGRTLLNMSVYDESDADNARLIVAAPELLAVLRDCIQSLQYAQEALSSLNGASETIALSIAAANAAIAKAEGKS